MNTVYLRFLSQRVKWTMCLCTTQNTGCLSERLNEKDVCLLTCCKTFSAKISCSREISTTFPSICLPQIKETYSISHEKSLQSIFKPFQMTLVKQQQVIFTSRAQINWEQMSVTFSVKQSHHFVCGHLCPWVILILSESTSGISHNCCLAHLAFQSLWCCNYLVGGGVTLCNTLTQAQFLG